jgi:predicted RecB family endonuclease
LKGNEVRKRTLVIAAGLAAALLMAACGNDDDTAAAAGPVPAQEVQASTIDVNALRLEMRSLWEDHIAWTRLFIVSAVDGLADLDATAARLLANQKAIGDAIKPFFGNEAGTKLNDLLDEHILIAADVIASAKEGDDKGVAKDSKRWYRNGVEIADFLADAGIGSRTDLQAMMKGHLDTTLEEAVARLSGDHEAEIAAYDEVRSHIQHMSDALADGIANAAGKVDAGYEY